MVTTNELYDQLGLAQKKADTMRAIHWRKIRREEDEAINGKPVNVHPDCLTRGHSLKGSWTIVTTASGKTYAKCGRCDQGYL